MLKACNFSLSNFYLSKGTHKQNLWDLSLALQQDLQNNILVQYFQGYHHKEFYFFAVLFLPVFKIFHDQNQALQWYSRVGKLDQFCFKIIPFLKRLAWVGVAEYVK